MMAAASAAVRAAERRFGLVGLRRWLELQLELQRRRVRRRNRGG